VAGAHRLRRELPHAELVVLEDAGHFVWEDEPERTAAALTDFVTRL
jgi:pimeloyl-ACP methyl ester carboxylesterase